MTECSSIQPVFPSGASTFRNRRSRSRTFNFSPFSTGATLLETGATRSRSHATFAATYTTSAGPDEARWHPESTAPEASASVHATTTREARGRMRLLHSSSTTISFRYTGARGSWRVPAVETRAPVTCASLQCHEPRLPSPSDAGTQQRPGPSSRPSSLRGLQCVLAMASAEFAFVAVAPGSSFPAVVASKEKSCTSGVPPRFAESKNFFD